MIGRAAKSSNRAIFSVYYFSEPIAEATTEKNNQVMLRAILTDLGDPNRWQTLFQPALEAISHSQQNRPSLYTDHVIQR
jgi:cell division inhibitor SulA